MLYCSCQPSCLSRDEAAVCLVLIGVTRPEFFAILLAAVALPSRRRSRSRARAQEAPAAGLPCRRRRRRARSSATAKSSRRCMNMPFVQGDRLRTANGRAEIDVPRRHRASKSTNTPTSNAMSPRACACIAGTMDHMQRRRTADTPSRVRAYLPQDLQDVRRARSIRTARGSTTRRTATSGIRPSRRTGGRTTTATGRRCPRTAGRGSASTPGRGRRTTTAAGAIARNAGSGFPGRTWGPAWVSWASAPDYVSWCPLGFDGRPVFALSAGSEPRRGTAGRCCRAATSARAATTRTADARRPSGGSHRPRRSSQHSRAPARRFAGGASRQSPVVSHQSAVRRQSCSR